MLEIDVGPLLARLQRAARAVPSAVPEVFREEVPNLHVAIIAVTPLERGPLRESVEVYTEDGGNTLVARTDLGSMVDGYNYAGKQHETQYDNYTTPGTGPKFIENPARKRLPNITKALLARAAQKVRGR